MKTNQSNLSAAGVRRRHHAFFEQFDAFLESYLGNLGKPVCTDDSTRGLGSVKQFASKVRK
jgi:hypothetical protein